MLDCDIDLKDITSIYTTLKGLRPRIIVGYCEQNRPTGFRGEDL